MKASRLADLELAVTRQQKQITEPGIIESLNISNIYLANQPW